MLTTLVTEGLRTWATEVCVLLDACRQLVEYYGSDEEAVSFRQALEAPLWLVEAMRGIASGTDVDTSKTPPFAKFACSESVATMISPLLRIVVEWQPEFVADAKHHLGAHAWKRVVVPYGQFLGTVAMCVCHPLWASHPHLAPPAWSAPP